MNVKVRSRVGERNRVRRACVITVFGILASGTVAIENSFSHDRAPPTYIFRQRGNPPLWGCTPSEEAKSGRRELTLLIESRSVIDIGNPKRKVGRRTVSRLV